MRPIVSSGTLGLCWVGCTPRSHPHVSSGPESDSAGRIVWVRREGGSPSGINRHPLRTLRGFPVQAECAPLTRAVRPRRAQAGEAARGAPLPPARGREILFRGLTSGPQREPYLISREGSSKNGQDQEKEPLGGWRVGRFPPHQKRRALESAASLFSAGPSARECTAGTAGCGKAPPVPHGWGWGMSGT